MTHLAILVLSITRVRSLRVVPFGLMTHSINDKTISGLGSFRTYGSLRCVDSFLWDGPLLIEDSFTMRGSLGRYDSFA